MMQRHPVLYRHIAISLIGTQNICTMGDEA
jgi:hypothetical protein